MSARPLTSRAAPLVLAVALLTVGGVSAPGTAFAATPGPVTGVVVDGGTPGQLTVRWTEPANDPDYTQADIVVVPGATPSSDPHDPAAVAVGTVSKGTHVFATDAVADAATYSATVFADDGAGDLASGVGATGVVAILPVSGVHVKVVNHGINLTWTNSPEGATADVRYRTGDTPPAGPTDGTDAGSTTAGTMHVSLAKGVYSLAIFATNGSVTSPSKTVSSVLVSVHRPDEAPLVDTEGIDRHSLEVLWFSFPDKFRSEWRVYERKGLKQATDKDTLVFEGTGDQALVHGLDFNAPYSFTVYAVDSSHTVLSLPNSVLATTRIPGLYVDTNASGRSRTTTPAHTSLAQTTAVTVDGRHRMYDAFTDYGRCCRALSVVSRSTRGGHWTSPHPLSQRLASVFNVSAAASPAGDVAIGWTQEGGNHGHGSGVWVAYRVAGHKAWTHRHVAKKSGAFLADVVVDGAGHVHVAWSVQGSSAARTGVFYANDVHDGHWSKAAKVPGTGNADLIAREIHLAVDHGTRRLVLATNKVTDKGFSLTSEVGVTTAALPSSKSPQAHWSRFAKSSFLRFGPDRRQDVDGVAASHGHVWVGVDRISEFAPRSGDGVFLASGNEHGRLHAVRRLPQTGSHAFLVLVAADTRGRLWAASNRFSLRLEPSGQGVFVQRRSPKGLWTRIRQVSDSAYDVLSGLATDAGGHEYVGWLRV
jgi:hypothetical protein